jgi:DNA-binding XRE family transcriptional regulator
MMSKAELARKAGLSTLTIDRVEAGRPCRLDTKRKILLALGLKVSDKDRIFGAADDEPVAARTEASQRQAGEGFSADASRGATTPSTASNAGPSNGPRAGNGEGIR